MTLVPLRRNEYVTISQAATRLATNEARVRQWIHRHGVTKKGRTYLFRQLEQIEYVIRHPEQRGSLTIAG